MTDQHSSLSPEDRNQVQENDHHLTLSAKAKLNVAVLERLKSALTKDPEMELFSRFPTIYKGALLEQKQLNPASSPISKNKPPQKRPGAVNFCKDLVTRAKSAEIIYPLSNETLNFLSGLREADSELPVQGCLLQLLSKMILTCEKLWELPIRGVVLKCNENLVAKIIRNSEFTEYTSLQYLAKNAPEIPAPKPHGLVKFNGARIMFMTYFPSMTLESAWPKLTHQDKTSIQTQLDGILTKLRCLKWTGQPLGGVDGEGVVDNHRENHSSREMLSSHAEFEDFQFSIAPYGNSSWVKFLRSLLPRCESSIVFTHGDFRTANIMVDIVKNGKYIVTGIIDWETSGFYPNYFESSKCLYSFRQGGGEDWWEYLPQCISPSTHPERWLVGRLWDEFIET